MIPEAQRYQQLFADLRPAIKFVQVEVQRALDETDPGLYVCTLVSAFRTFDEQRVNYAKGRVQLDTGAWRTVDPKLIVTQSLPGQSAHNVVANDGSPCSLAGDLAILVKATGHYLPDKHLAWALIPACAHRAPIELEAGAFWGDWPHIQLAGWKKRAPLGRLLLG